MAVSMLAWPLAVGVGSALLVITPWALGCFSSNSAQQARLALAAPALATALISLNSSAMYLGQFAGAASGGAMIATSGYAGLSWVALAWMSLALVTSLWAARRMRGGAHA
jgi:predicted MFS family arabinose efflux permease